MDGGNGPGAERARRRRFSIAIMGDGRNVDFLGSGNFGTAGAFKADTNVSLHLAFLSDALSITVGTDGAGADFY